MADQRVFHPAQRAALYGTAVVAPAPERPRHPASTSATRDVAMAASFRGRLWRAAAMGIAGGLTGLAIGAAIDQIDPYVDGGAPPPRVRELERAAAPAVVVDAQPDAIEATRVDARGGLASPRAAGALAHLEPPLAAGSLARATGAANRVAAVLLPAAPGVVAAHDTIRCADRTAGAPLAVDACPRPSR